MTTAVATSVVVGPTSLGGSQQTSASSQDSTSAGSRPTASQQQDQQQAVQVKQEQQPSSNNNLNRSQASGNKNNSNSNSNSNNNNAIKQQQQPTVTVARKRGRRRQQAIPEQPNGLDRVFVWDIDGSLIRSDIISDPCEANMEPSVLASVTDKLSSLSKRFKELTLSFCEEHLFLSELESSDQTHIDDVPSEPQSQQPTQVLGPGAQDELPRRAESASNQQQSVALIDGGSMMADSEQLSSGQSSTNSSSALSSESAHDSTLWFDPSMSSHSQQPDDQPQEHHSNNDHQHHLHNQLYPVQQQQQQQQQQHQANLSNQLQPESNLSTCAHYPPSYEQVPLAAAQTIQQHHHQQQEDSQPPAATTPLITGAAYLLGETDQQSSTPIGATQDPTIQDGIWLESAAAPSLQHQQQAQHYHQHHQPDHLSSSTGEPANNYPTPYVSAAAVATTTNTYHQLQQQQATNLQPEQPQRTDSTSSSVGHTNSGTNYLFAADQTAIGTNQLVGSEQADQTGLWLDSSNHLSQHPLHNHHHQQHQHQHQHQLQHQHHHQHHHHHSHSNHPHQHQLQQQYIQAEPTLTNAYPDSYASTYHQLQQQQNHQSDGGRESSDTSGQRTVSNQSAAAYLFAPDQQQESSAANQMLVTGSSTTLESASQQQDGLWFDSSTYQQPVLQHPYAQQHHHHNVHHHHHHQAHNNLFYPSNYHQHLHHQLQHQQQHQQQHQHLHSNSNHNRHHNHHHSHPLSQQHQHLSDLQQPPSIVEHYPTQMDEGQHLHHHSHLQQQQQQHQLLHDMSNCIHPRNGQQQQPEAVDHLLMTPHQHAHQQHRHLSHHQHQHHHHHHHHPDHPNEQQLRQNPEDSTAEILISTGLGPAQVQQGESISANPSVAATTSLRAVQLSNQHKQQIHRLSLRFHRIRTVYNMNRSIVGQQNSPDMISKNLMIADDPNNNNHPQLMKLTHSNASPLLDNSITNNGNQMVALRLLGKELNEILAEIDHYTLDWRKQALDCLRLISESPNCTNIIVTKLPLVIALGHLVCLGLGQYFEVDQVYSASKTNKEACLKRIKKRFGAQNRCSYIIVGGRDDVEMAKRLDLPSWNTSRSDGHRQLMQLFRALKEGFLM